MISVNDVSKRFGAVTALDRVSLSIAPGERVAIVGTNGSGKTTLLRAIAGLVRVSGTITLGGVDVGKRPELALRSLAYAPQIAPPLDAPVGEVVRAQCALRGIARSSVHERALRLGLDLAPIEKTRFRDLSGGMKQKVLAAMALAAEAKVLVCDEPTANLDPRARAAFFAQVDERPADAVLVLCSHRVDEVRQLVHRVIEMRDGRVVRDAPLEDLMAGLKTFRIEVTTRGDELRAVTEFLMTRGFERIGIGRFAGSFTQDEKLEVVAALLRHHEGAVLDLGVFDDGEVGGFVEDEPTSGTVCAAGRVA